MGITQNPDFISIGVDGIHRWWQQLCARTPAGFSRGGASSDRESLPAREGLDGIDNPTRARGEGEEKGLFGLRA
ncbi:unnamed protein product [Arabis nemorensis]|uniref:Uncharacterized protein n=1 Tax=Arabis nemorensis TaxID=586526 RepID=A0A565B0V6_9BRAS|nr:unnamed protein product [Arabis nemorensis]